MSRIRVPGMLRRAWLVYVDHSVVGIWPTRAKALAAAKLRAEQASKPITHTIVGAYRLDENATITEVS